MIKIVQKASVEMVCGIRKVVVSPLSRKNRGEVIAPVDCQCGIIKGLALESEVRREPDKN